MTLLAWGLDLDRIAEDDLHLLEAEDAVERTPDVGQLLRALLLACSTPTEANRVLTVSTQSWM